MLYMEQSWQPVAHGEDQDHHTDKALKVPGVLAVITGETLAKYNLHWMRP